MSDDKYKPPETTAADGAHAAARAGISALPVIGGAGVEVFNSVVSVPMERRLFAWRERVGQGLAKLEQRVDDLELENLRNNEVFQSAVIQASRAALATHDEEKLEALRNAVLNVAVGAAPDESRQALFLAIADTLTPLHLRALTLLRDPLGYFKVLVKGPGPSVVDGNMGGSMKPAEVMCRMMPEVRSDFGLAERVFDDLWTKGLVGKRGMAMRDHDAEHNWQARRTSELGDQLLEFLSSPIPDDSEPAK